MFHKLPVYLLAICLLVLLLHAGQAGALVVLFGQQQVITTATGWALSVWTADLDGDGDLDVLSASRLDNKIAWYENLDGQGAFGPQQLISTAAAGAIWVIASDIDGDGDMDVLSASSNDDKIAWYENVDGQGAFGPQQIITATADGAESVAAADLDGDGDLDVLSSSLEDDKVAWYENLDGQGAFGPERIITLDTDNPMMVLAADLDGDGDFDVLSASGDDDKLAWYENMDGQGAFGPQQLISTSADGPFSVLAADFDGDGDLDVLSASANDDKVAWYENVDGQGAFGPQQVISLLADEAMALAAGDIDLDGDLDVLSASNGDHKVAWYENMNGQGAFGAEQVITTNALGAYSIAVGDLDGDGDLDVLSASWADSKIAWYENLFGPYHLFLAVSLRD